MLEMKVKFNDKILWKQYGSVVAIISSIVTLVSFCFPLQNNCQTIGTAIIFIATLIGIFLLMWLKANKLQEVQLHINSSKVNIKIGDIFLQDDLKVIGVNNFYDTIADDKIIAKNSLHGKFLNLVENGTVGDSASLENAIASDEILKQFVECKEVKTRKRGRKTRYHLGSILEYHSFILTAFAKFDDQNKACLSAKEYTEFLISFWKNIDTVYAGRTINIPLMGAGITRFSDGKPSKQELLETMLWTLKISGFHITYPQSRINFIIHEDDAEEIDFYHIQHNPNFQ